MWNILEFEELPSTNTLAAERLARGEARHGDVITARHQTAGRGRSAGRVWNDSAGDSLLMSIVLTEIPEPAHLLQYRAALAVLHAIRGLNQEITASDVQLKWPNDILIHGKKVCGLLTEAQWNGSAMRSAIVGIGLNVRQHSLPLELSGIATSLRKCGIATTIPEVRTRILDAVDAELDVSTASAVLTRLRLELAWMSKLPSLEFTGGDGQKMSSLHFVGVDGSGAVLLRQAGGQAMAHHSGSLSWNKIESLDDKIG